MCGIIGTNFDFFYNNSLYHRGPDFKESYCDESVSLFHNRLSIIDLSTKANQPFRFKDLVLVFNGEIYNYKEIKQELKEYNFKTCSDTEVLLYSYHKWGEECLEKFNGDFAFCIYDKKKKELFCARDRVGNKPFYYYFDGKKFIFASELKAFKNYVLLEFNIQKLGDAILFSINDNDEHTIYKNIYNLKPSHYLKFNLITKKLKIKKYWSVKKRDINCFDKALEEFEYLFKDSIKLRLQADVSVGGMLSGGIDSSLVAFFAQDISFFSIVHPHYKDIDESYYIGLLQSKLNLKIKYLTPSFNNFIKDFNDLIYTQDDIFRSLSIYMQYFIFKNANVKVMLSGQGADELFGGYYHHIARFIVKDEKEFLNRVKLYKCQALEEFKTGKKLTLPNKIKGKLLKEDNLKYLEIVKKVLIDYEPNYDLLLKKYTSNINEALKQDTLALNLPMLLRFEDRNAMRFSIENRTPFTDYRIIEFALNLPIEYRFKNGLSKYFLRVFASKFLPKKIVFRLDKKGFEAPDNKWLQKLNLNNLVEFRLFLFEKLKNSIKE